MKRPKPRKGNMYDNPLGWNEYIVELREYCDFLEQELERSEEHGTELREELDWIYSQGDDEDYH